MAAEGSQGVADPVQVLGDVGVRRRLHDVPVLHLGHDGRLTPHPPSERARITESGLRYDAAATDHSASDG